MPPSHPLLPHALGHLALALTAEGEFVTAEGLYRSATDTLTGAGGDAGAHAMPASHVPLLLPTLEAFASLLERLETNGKPRLAEAAQVRERARMLRVSYASALPTCTDAGWLGLEPWYAASCDVDWLGACVAPADEATAGR